MTGCPASDFLNLEEHFEHLAPELHQDFWGAMTHMREQCPVARSDRFGGFWVLTRFEDVSQALLDHETFSSAQGVLVVRPPDQPLLPPLETDPPEQRAWRRIVNPYLLTGAVAAHEPAIRAIAESLLDRCVAKGRCDFLVEFAVPFPGTVFFKQFLGLDDAELALVQSWTKPMGARPGTPESAEGYRNLDGWVRALLARRRAQPGAARDLVGALLGAEAEGVIEPSQTPLALSLLIGGGLDTTKVALCNAVRHLAQRPALFARLAAEPVLIPSAIEEFLRFESPTNGMSRIATRDVEIGGKRIKKGDRVLLYWTAANRDPAQFSRADELDFARQPNRHLSFGAGVHFCIGAPLARLNLRIALEEFVKRVDQLRLAEGFEAAYDIGVHRALRSLPILFEPRSRG